MFPACIKLTSSGIIFTGNIRCLDNMTVLKTQSPALAGTNEKLWLEKACCNLIPDLSLWIIEYAWSKRMMEVLEVLGPPLWLEGDWCLLTLEEPCQIRVVSAEVWRIVQARDIKHFERVTRFLDVSYLLVPRLVTPIKHMKIMFGLQTLVIMWMLWNDQSAANIDEKIESLFPNNLPQYYKCSRKHMELMQKNREDFKSFAHALARDRSMREAYIRDLMEEQYGERYAQKLEERLSHYLEALDKALPQSTCIEQVLDQSLPQAAGEKILKKLLSRDSASLANVLRRLLNCAVTSNQNCDDSSSLSPSSNTCEEQKDAPKSNKPSQRTLHVVSRPSQESKETRLSQTSSKQLFISQGLWQKRKESPQGSLTETCHDDG
nr:TERF1-interacting nuclear factor 2 isoform X1 [Misgurnus anguillicaudatus]